MRLESRFQWLRRAILKIIKICQYIPLLWRDEDWDWHFILILLKYKLNRTHACIRSNDIIVEEEQLEIGRQIGIVVKLLERVEKDEYGDWLETAIKEKYCDNFMEYLPKHSVMYEIMHGQGPADYETRFTASEKELMQTMWIESYKAADRMRSRDIQRAMNVMAKHMQWWWD